MIAALAIYRTQCANCHGQQGRGDGPQSAMIHPPDWTTAQFQDTHSEEQLRMVIQHGRGAMPAFGQALRPEAIDLLVRLVRQFGGRQ